MLDHCTSGMDPPQEMLPNRDLELQQLEMDQQRERLELEELAAQEEVDRLTTETRTKTETRRLDRIEEETEKAVLTEKLRKYSERYRTICT